MLASWGAFALSAVAGLFLSPFVVHTLGASGFGVWVLIGSLTGTLNIFDLGMRSAVTRFVAREHAREDHEAASASVGTARVLFLAAGATVLMIGAVLAVGLPYWFSVPPDLRDPARVVLMVSATSLAVVLTNGLYGGVLAGLQRLDVLGMTDVALEALRIGLVLAVLSLGAGLVGLALIGLLLSLLRRAILQRKVATLYPELGTSLRRPAAADVRLILSVSAYSTIIYSSVSAITQATELVVGAFLPLAMLSYYAIGATLPIYAHALNRPIAQTVHPRASRLESLGDVDGLRALILTTGRFSALVLFPLVITFIVRGRSFVDIWMGAEFKEPAGGVLAVLGVGLLFAGTRHVMQAAFVGSGRHKPLGPWYVGEAIVVVVATLVVVPRWGIVGAAWATVLPSVLLSVVVFPLLCRQHFDVPPLAVWARFWFQPALAMLPFLGASLLFEARLPVESYLGFFTQVFASLPFAAIGALSVGLSQSERATLLTPMRGFVARMRLSLRS